MSIRFSLLMAAGAGAGLTGQSFGALTISTLTDGPAFPAGSVISSPVSGNPQAPSGTNQQENAGQSYAQTFVTGASGFQLDRIVIYSGGKGGGDIRLNIYPEPVGGGDSDGFVNTSFSTDLLGGGNGLTGTVNGSGGLQYIVFDLSGTDEITLAANTKYAIEIDVLTGQMSWQRSNQTEYPNGNLYRAATESNFNGAPPANNRGERTQVGGSPQRDGYFALYAVPEPASIGLIAVGGLALFGRRRRA